MQGASAATGASFPPPWQIPSLRVRADADLARRTRISALSYFVLWAVLAAATDLLRQHPLETLGAGALFLLVGTARVVLATLFSRLYPLAPQFWQLAHGAGVLVSALVWGVLCALGIYWNGIGETALMVLVATAGIAAGGMAALAPARTVMALFLAVLLLPSVVAIQLVMAATASALPWLILAFLIYLLLTGRRLHDEYWEALRNARKLEEGAQALAELSQRNEMILEGVGDGIYGLDKQGRFQFVNPAAASLLGYAPEALLGREAHSAIHHSRADGQPYPVEDCAVQRALQEGHSQRVDSDVYWRQDGRPMPVEFLATPMRRDDEIAGVVVVFRDITARQQLEQEMRKAIRLAEEANRGKTEFLAAMGHELRTPLNGVLGITGLLDNTVLNALQRELLQALKSSAETLLASMNNILEYTSIESGATRPQSLNFHLPGAVRAAMERFQQAAGQAGVTLDEELDPRVPARLQGDATLLQQVLTKLLDNAIKFAAPGQVRLRVRPVASAETPAMCRLRIEVLDHGPGIPESQRERIFEPFTQVDSSSTRPHGGLGLGLAIARRLVLLQGGRIGCERGAEPGNVFWCELSYGIVT